MDSAEEATSTFSFMQASSNVEDEEETEEDEPEEAAVSVISMSTALSYTRALIDLASDLGDDGLLTLAMNTKACVEDHHIAKQCSARQSKISDFFKRNL